jgi:hypothetical protein
MRGRRWIGGSLVASALTLGTAAEAATLSADYLVGRWTTGGVDACTRAEHERTVFRADGTFATERGGKAVAVGFWQVEDDRLDLHVLASPAAIEPGLQEHVDGGYGYVRIKALTFDLAEDAFRMVQSAGGELQGLNVVRCPAPS